MALRDLNLVSVSEFTLKAEQESALTALLAGRNGISVLPTGYGKSLIYQMFVRAKNHELNGNASILVISPLKKHHGGPATGDGITRLPCYRLFQFIGR